MKKNVTAPERSRIATVTQHAPTGKKKTEVKRTRGGGRGTSKKKRITYAGREAVADVDDVREEGVAVGEDELLCRQQDKKSFNTATHWCAKMKRRWEDGDLPGRGTMR